MREGYAEDHPEVRGSCSTGAMERPIGARWSMAAIADAVGGVGHFGQEAWTVRWAAVGKDRLDVAIGPA